MPVFATLLGLVLLGWNTVALPRGDSGDASDASVTPVDREQLRTLSRYFLNLGVEPPRPFRPLKNRTVEESRKLEAIAWFCTARKYVLTRQFNKAVEAYQRALTYDPKASEIYRDLLAVLRVLGRRREFEQYLRQAVEVDPQNHEFLFQLAIQSLAARDLEGAAKLLERALNSPKLDRNSFDYVRICLLLGQIHADRKETKEAAKYFEVVLAALKQPRRYGLYDHPDRNILYRDLPGLYERMGRTFLAAKRYELALDAFRLGQESAGARGEQFELLIARTYAEQGKFEDALTHIEKYIRMQTPQSTEPYELLADVLEKLGRKEEVIRRLEEALRRDPQNPSLRFFLAQQYERAGRADRARQLYEELAEKSPTPQVYLALAGFHWKQGNVEQALELLEKAAHTAFRQRDLRALQLLEARAAEFASPPDAYRRAAEIIREQLQKSPTAVGFEFKYFFAHVAKQAKDLDTAVRLLTLCRDERPTLDIVIIELHELLMGARRYKEAAENLRFALTKGPWAVRPNPIAYAELARALLLAGELDEAATEAKRTIELLPTRATGYMLLASVYVREKKFKDAIELLEDARKKLQDRPDEERRLLYQLSNVYFEMGDLNKTEAVLLEIIRRWPDDPGAYNDLGYIWADHNKNLDKAEEFIRKALELYDQKREPGEPEKNAAYLDSMGWVLFKKGKYQEALHYLLEAANAPEGDDGVIWDHLGDCYYRLGNREEAIRAWQKAAELLKSEPSERERSRLGDVLRKIDRAQKNQEVFPLKANEQDNP